MSATSLIRQCVTISLILTTTGIASARRPPSLASLQEKTARVLATCSSAPFTSGYRDMLTRFSSKGQPSRAPAVVAELGPRDHLVFKCAGGEVHEGGGYREMLVRFRHEGTAPQWADADCRSVE